MVKKVYLLKKNVRKKKSGKKSERRVPRIFSPQKHECHSHIDPFDKKEWHSSFAPYFGSSAQEWRSNRAVFSFSSPGVLLVIAKL